MRYSASALRAELALPPRVMRVTVYLHVVKLTIPRRLTVKIHSMLTIGYMKHCISEATGLDPSRMMLIFAGTVPGDSKLLQRYQKESTFHCVMKQRTRGELSGLFPHPHAFAELPPHLRTRVCFLLHSKDAFPFPFGVLMHILQHLIAQEHSTASE